MQLVEFHKIEQSVHALNFKYKTEIGNKEINLIIKDDNPHLFAVIIDLFM